MDDRERKRLQAVYDREASHYDRNRFEAPAGRLLQEIGEMKLISILKERGPRPLGEMKIADLGCGTGRLAAPVAANARLLAGVDLSPGMLGETRSREGADRVRLLRADGFRLPLADASVDAVYSMRFFHLFPPARYPELLAEIGRVLAPGGVAVLEVNNPDYAWGVGWLRDRLIRGKVEKREISSTLREKSMLDLFEGISGWANVEVQGVWPFRFHKRAQRLNTEEALALHEAWSGDRIRRRSMFFFWVVAVRG